MGILRVYLLRLSVRMQPRAANAFGRRINNKSLVGLTGRVEPLWKPIPPDNIENLQHRSADGSQSAWPAWFRSIGDLSQVAGGSAVLEAADSHCLCKEKRNNWLIHLATLHSSILCNPGLIIAPGSQPRSGWPWIWLGLPPSVFLTSRIDRC